MKILYLNYIPSPYRVDFFNELSEQCDLTVVYYNSEISERPNWVYKEDEHRYKHHFLFEGESNFEFSGYLKLMRFLANHNFDFIVVGGYAKPIEIFAIFWLRLKGKPFILNTDGGFYQGGYFKLLLKRVLIKSASNYLASGSLAAQTLKAYGAESKKITNYHFTSLFKNEINDEITSHEAQRQLRETLDIPTGGKIVLTVGRYIPLKGFELVIEALAQLNDKNIYLYMLGEGPMRSHYEQLITKYNLQNQIFLTGEQSKENVLSYCKASNVLVLPTLTTDVWGLVINEAMSCGLPVITSDRVGAAYDMVKDNETGYMVSAGSSSEIANALNKVFNQNDVLSINALKMAKRYTIEQMVDDHINLFNSLSTINYV